MKAMKRSEYCGIKPSKPELPKHPTMDMVPIGKPFRAKLLAKTGNYIASSPHVFMRVENDVICLVTSGGLASGWNLRSSMMNKDVGLCSIIAENYEPLDATLVLD